MVDITRRQLQPGNQLSERSPLSHLIRELTNWSPFEEFVPSWSSRDKMFVPAFEVKEKKDGYVIKADLPGVKEEDVHIDVSGNRLTISGKRESERQEENETYFFAETAYGSFSRTLTLPDMVDVEAVEANLDNGQLVLNVPKRLESQARRIELGRREGKKDEAKKDKNQGQRAPS